MEPRGGQNSNHRRVLSSTRTHLEQLLTRIEQALLDEDGGHFVQDLPPAHRQHFLLRVRELRRAIDRGLMRLGLPPTQAETRSSWALQSGLLAAEIDLEETSPERLRAYGPLPPAEAEEVSAVIAALTQELSALRNAVALAATPAAPSPRRAVASLERRIAGLARRVEKAELRELRPEVDALAERARSSRIEVALFGRVSSGKSSLIDAVLGTEVLPVGVTPVTAVSVHLRRGAPESATIVFVSGGREVLSPFRLADFVTEQKNPGNVKGVANVEVQLPDLPLPDWLGLIDTPGVGAALSGNPGWQLSRCELAVVLADASVGIGGEEVELLRRASELGLDVEVLLGKADLLSEDERRQSLRHAHSVVKTQLARELPVQMVSARGELLIAARDWFEARIRRRHADAESWFQEVMGQRVSHLRGSAAQTLCARSHRH